MNNIFLFDIDGTLSFDGVIPKSAKDTLKELKAKGNIVMLATGRSLSMIGEILNEVSVDGAILNNGAYAILNNEEIFRSPIDKNKILEMLNDGLNVSVLYSDQFTYFKEDPIFKVFCDSFTISMPRLMDISVLDSKDAYSLGVYSFDADLVDYKKYGLKFVRVSKWGFDVMNEGISKASAFKSLREKFPGYRIIAFGDNYNDYEMLEASDISVAMGSAPAKIKNISTYVTKSAVDDGVRYAVKELIKVI